MSLFVMSHHGNATIPVQMALLIDCHKHGVLFLINSVHVPRFVVERQIRGSAVGCMLHVNACCRQASNNKLVATSVKQERYMKIVPCEELWYLPTLLENRGNL
ncbi:hypothetical protein EVAR_18417_1 [Eumeta japonica]|uniref:Uncharacterized protein n=1 Tax=Eumeta variegata TaxID=151549 RepID=A0A4C1UV90_EUMVA|nr:hypothetical protein EVAR_18417_1 [Eumeta japonica]